MSKVFETGHAKNVANFETIISFCRNVGADYNPSLNRIKIVALDVLILSSRQSIQKVIDNVVAFNNAINERRDVFKDLKTLSTKLGNALGSSGVSTDTLNDYKSINTKIQGARVGKKPKIAETGLASDAPAPQPVLDEDGNPKIVETIAEVEKKNISVSQQSYVQLTEHFAKSVSMLSAVADYAPNEPELQLPAINAKLQAMRDANSNFINSYIAVTLSRISRNDILYKQTTGLHAVALEIKKYLKSVYGPKSEKYKTVSGLKFKRPKK